MTAERGIGMHWTFSCLLLIKKLSPNDILMNVIISYNKVFIITSKRRKQIIHENKNKGKWIEPQLKAPKQLFYVGGVALSLGSTYI